LLVACLCAAWCRTCDAYRDTLAATRDALARAHPAAALRFVWVDIEDEAALVGDLDIEDFPTLLVARGAELLFFGPVLPHAQTLDRLVRGMLEHPVPVPAAAWPADAVALPARLASHAAI
jgi:hypothetical protein